MKKYISGILLLLLVAYTSVAQTYNDTTATRKVSYTLGIQVNELAKQILSLNNSSTQNNNPFILTLNVNDKKSGWGARGGIGFSYISYSSTTPSAIGAPDTYEAKAKALRARIGIEKAFVLSPKWSTGVGLDFVYASIDTSATQSIPSSSFTSNTKSTSKQSGGGPMAWLRYSLSKRITIGTEMSIYYLTGHNKVRSYYTNSGIIPEETTDNKLSDATLSLPVTFFLAVKF